ncbi:MAG: response regulator [bacterium]
MRKILVVDSDEQILTVLSLKLSKENFEVKTLSSSVNAVDVVIDFKPHLIISEMVLPEINGVDFLKRVKMHPETMTIPFIFLSNSRNVENKILAHEMGAEAFFMKPIFIKVLTDKIKHFFEEKSKKSAPQEKKNDFIKGELSNISIIDILNIIAENKSTGEVAVASSTSETATISFVNGSVIRIETATGKGKNGIEELYKILSWVNGTFDINYKELSVAKNISFSHDKLIAKAKEWFDSYSENLSQIPPTDSLVFVDFGKFVGNINKLPDAANEIIKNIREEGAQISSIIEKTLLDKKEVVKYLKQMIETGILSFEKESSKFNFSSTPEWLPRKEKESLESDAENKEESKEETVKKTESEEVEPVGVTVDIDLFEEQFIDDATEMVESVQSEEALGDFKEIKELLNQNELVGDDSAATKKTSFFIVLLLSFATILLLLSFLFFKNFENAASSLLPDSKKQGETAKIKEDFDYRQIVLTEEQKKMKDRSIADLINTSTVFFDSKEVGKAIEANEVALYKLKTEKKADNIEYEKVVTNMAIYLYSAEKYKKALYFAEESLLLRDDEKPIELKAAILEELKKPTAAASLLRAKINDEKFAHKKEEWMKEINRLEKIER